MLRVWCNRLSIAAAPVRIILFLVTLLCLWIPLAAPLYAVIPDANLESIVTLLVLYGEFVALLQLWGWFVYHQPAILIHYGLVWTQQNGLELLQGMAIGLGCLLSLFVLEGSLGWLTWQSFVSYWPRILLEGAIVGLGVGFAEELFFRGWLLDELQRDYGLSRGLWLSSGLYTLAHFIRPLAVILKDWPEVFGLLLLGLSFVWAKRSTQGRLGLAIGLHAGLVWGYYLIKVGQLIEYRADIPTWLTGINGNPLAGAMGLLCLSILAKIMRQRAIAPCAASNSLQISRRLKD